ncbi:MAG: hypothetical protein NWR83_05220 [Salibacteraceae bacterium]|nr:hypothetical protein [Salibacteraceae bacterium]
MKLKDSIYCFLMTLVHLAYTLVFPSIINGERFIGNSSRWLEPSYIHAFFISRIKFGEFARRPVTTWLIQGLEYIGFPLEYAFITVLYIGLLIALLLLFKLSETLTQQRKFAYLSVFIFTTTFWVIHAVFAEIYAYDEPWQYVFVFAALLFLAKKAWFKFSVFLLLSMMVRESSVLLLPGIFFFFMLQKPLFSKTNVIRTLKVGWAVPAYALFLWLVILGKNLGEKSSSYMEDMRFKHLYYSFSDIDIGIDTLTSFLMAFIVPFTLLVLYKSKFKLETERAWIWATILNISINTAITFALTMGRETRIFAQPVLMLSPFLGMFLWKWIESLKSTKPTHNSNLDSWIKTVSIWLFFGSLCFAFSLYAYEVYWPTDTKFFNGFQHHVYLTLAFCTAALLLNFTLKNRIVDARISAIGFLLIALVFVGNQKGYRAYDLYKPVADFVTHQNAQTDRKSYLIVGTKTPNIAENYFSAKDIDALAGNFNFQLPLKQFFYRDEAFVGKDIIYVEQEPAINFPFRYILSQYGRLENTVVNDWPSVILHTAEAPELEENAFVLVQKEKGFQLKTKSENPEPFAVNEEYSPAFKTKLSELNLDTLYSIAAKVDFKTSMSSEAAIVVNISSADTSVWQHEFLTIFLIEPNNWNTAYKAISLNNITDPNAEISFYVWNKGLDQTEVKNLEIVFNSKFLPPKKVD